MATTETLTFTAASGYTFAATFHPVGGRYGRDGVVIAEQPMVTFSQVPEPGYFDTGWGIEGPMTYFVVTILGCREGRVLNLHGMFPEYTIDADTLDVVKDWLIEVSGIGGAG